MQKILCKRLWWLTLHRDSKAHCKVCDVCQRTGKPSRRDVIPLNLQIKLQPFEKWAIDFIGPIKPQGKTRMRYIIATIEYLTHWEEAKLVKDFIAASTVKFLFEHIITCFRCLKILISDHGTHFLNETISTLTE